MTKKGFGIVSTGRMAGWFCDDLVYVEGAKLAGVCSRKQETAQRFATAYDIPNVYTSVTDLINDPAVDILYVASPHTQHANAVIEALEAGKAVLCEKPMTARLDETARIIDTARQTNSYLMEAMWTWTLPAIRKAKEWVDEGRIGKITQIQADFGYPVPYHPTQREYDKTLGGGCLLEMGIYPVAFAVLFAGDVMDALSVLAQKAPNGVEDHVMASFMAGGVHVALSTSLRVKLGNGAIITGEEGYITIPNFFRAERCDLHVLDDVVDSFEALRQSRGYDFQAVDVLADLEAGKTESSLVPLSKSLVFASHIAAMKEAAGVNTFSR